MRLKILGVALILALGGCGGVKTPTGVPYPPDPNAPHTVDTFCSVTEGETTQPVHAQLLTLGIASAAQGPDRVTMTSFPFSRIETAPFHHITSILEGTIEPRLQISCTLKELGALKGWYFECLMYLDGTKVDDDSILYRENVLFGDDFEDDMIHDEDTVVCEYPNTP